MKNEELINKYNVVEPATLITLRRIKMTTLCRSLSSDI